MVSAFSIASMARPGVEGDSADGHWNAQIEMGLARAAVVRHGCGRGKSTEETFSRQSPGKAIGLLRLPSTGPDRWCPAAGLTANTRALE
jgi:hypothetical protein